jgi:hypothetical protein
MDKRNSFLNTLSFRLWAILAIWLHVGAPQKIQEKINLIPILNKTSPRAHMESELGVLGVSGKLVKYTIHSSKRNN